MHPGDRLETGHFIRRKDHVPRPQGEAFPLPVIQPEDRGGALQQAGITGKEPLLKEPGAQRILVEAAPDRTIRGREAEFPSALAHVKDRKTRQRVASVVRGALAG
jgi:hypothetical protein